MTLQNAIQSDATNDGHDQQHDDSQQQAGQQGFVSARDKMMAAIEQQVEQQYADMGAIPAPAQADQAAQQTPAQQAVPASDRQMVKVKVDGEEQERPLEEVVKGYQIEAAARKRLEEAALQKKDLEQREKELAEREARLQQGADHQQQTPSSTDESTFDKARALLDTLSGAMVGDEDEAERAVQMLAAVMGGGQPQPAVDESRISDMISQVESQREYQRDMQAAKALFDTEYSEINTDPNLAKVANDIFAAELQAGKSPTEAAKLAGDGTREWLKQFTGGRATDVSADRTARKQTIDTLPAAGGRSVSTNAGTETPADVIANMKRSRGQVV